MRARVRFKEDYNCRSVVPGTIKRWRAGAEAILVWWEPQDSVGARIAWQCPAGATIVDRQLYDVDRFIRPTTGEGGGATSS